MTSTAVISSFISGRHPLRHHCGRDVLAPGGEADIAQRDQAVAPPRSASTAPAMVFTLSKIRRASSPSDVFNP